METEYQHRYARERPTSGRAANHSLCCSLGRQDRCITIQEHPNWLIGFGDDRGPGLHNDLLDLFRGEFRVDLEHERNGAAHFRGSAGGATKAVTIGVVGGDAAGDVVIAVARSRYDHAVAEIAERGTPVDREIVRSRTHQDRPSRWDRLFVIADPGVAVSVAGSDTDHNSLLDRCNDGMVYGWKHLVVPESSCLHLEVDDEPLAASVCPGNPVDRIRESVAWQRSARRFVRLDEP